jgi:hypothetical protein
MEAAFAVNAAFQSQQRAHVRTKIVTLKESPPVGASVEKAPPPVRASTWSYQSNDGVDSENNHRQPVYVLTEIDTGSWRYRVLEIGQPPPYFLLLLAKRESSVTARRPESMQPECSNAGSKTTGCRMHFLPILLGLPESRISWRMEGRLKWRSESPATLIVGQRSSTTAAARRSWSKIWSGFDTDCKTEIFSLACVKLESISLTPTIGGK